MEGQVNPTNKRAALSLAAVPGDAATVPGDSMDFLSRLPDHLLAHILRQLPIKDAVKTSGLSRRWPGVWAQLPVLSFDGVNSSVPSTVLAAYEAHGELPIHSLTVFANQMDAQRTTPWQSLAARLLSGTLHFDNSCTVSQNTPQLSLDDDAIELPCYKKATEIVMDLGSLGLALPPTGVFDALRVMWLEHFWSRGQLSISHAMFPSLQELTICRVRQLVELTLESNSLLYIHLSALPEFQYLEILAPWLEELEVVSFFHDVPEPVAVVDAERLEVLKWEVPFVPEFRTMPPLHVLRVPAICTHWSEDICAEFLRGFPEINELEIQISFGLWMDNSPLLMKAITIPYVSVLWLWLESNGHNFEGRLVQLLTNCSGVHELNLSFQDRAQAQDYCSQECICHTEPFLWDDKVIQVGGLRRVGIVNFHGAPREVSFLDALVRRAPALQQLRIVSKAEDPCLEGIKDICPEGCVLEVKRIR